ncbi:protein SCO1/2 [Spirosomataceae bacterium TFI 002]|nr:protein SCO1/2 [Spirosomataceae bacterium TFI 002]
MNWKTKLFKSKLSVFFVALVVIASSCTTQSDYQNDSRVEVLPFFDEASFTPQWIDVTDQKLNSFHSIPDFHLVNQDGDSVSQKDLTGKIYVANFFFTTCPGICPQMTANLDILQEEYLNDNEIMLISHSVTPNRDSVEVLKSYADKRNIDSKKWLLVIGDREQIYNLGRNAYFVEENMGIEKTVDDFLHTENFVLIDKHKHIRGIYNGLQKTSIEQLKADIATLKKENRYYKNI